MKGLTALSWQFDSMSAYVELYALEYSRIIIRVGSF